MRKEAIYSAMEMRELAKACTYETFVRILKKFRMIYDACEGEWIDFEWGLGSQCFTTSIGYDNDGTPRLSDYIQFYNPDNDECDDEYAFDSFQYFKR